MTEHQASPRLRAPTFFAVSLFCAPVVFACLGSIGGRFTATASQLASAPNGPSMMGNWNGIVGYSVGFFLAGGLALMIWSHVTVCYLRLELRSNSGKPIGNRSVNLNRLEKSSRDTRHRLRYYFLMFAGFVLASTLLVAVVHGIRYHGDSFPWVMIFAMGAHSPSCIAFAATVFSKRWSTFLLWGTCFISIAMGGLFESWIEQVTVHISAELSDAIHIVGLKWILIFALGAMQVHLWIVDHGLDASNNTSQRRRSDLQSGA